MSSYEKCVKGATKIKLAPPKSKYIETILQGTRVGENGVAEIFRVLQLRLRDSTWTIAFKALIVVHLMMREGAQESTLRYLSSEYRKTLAMSTYSDIQTQGRNIRAYSNYLSERARSYAKTKQDFVGGASGRLKRLEVDKGLLRETESVQDCIQALLKCDFFVDEPENEISLTAFRLLVMDLLTLFQVMNEGTINVLEKYFEMSRPDAERALRIYKQFASLTNLVVRFLSMARQYEHSTRLEIPKIKHAPTSLANSLEEYLNDADFDLNRRQYLAQQEAKRGGKSITSSSKPFGDTKASTSKPAFPDAGPVSTAAHPVKGPAPDLIDFFESIEQKQQPMAQDPAQYQQQMYQTPFSGGFPQQMQQTGFQQQQPPPQQQQQQYQPQFQPQQQQAGIAQQSTNPFGQFQQQSQQQQQQQQPLQIQTQPTGAGFGGYTPQPQQNQMGFAQQNGMSPQQQQQPPSQFGGMAPQQQPQQTGTNPFRQSMMPQPTGQFSNAFTSSQAPPPMPSQPTGLNPFARSSPTIQANGSPFSSPPPQPTMQNTGFQQQSPQSLVPQQTGTNPFARTAPNNNSQPSVLMSQATGSTNPFRQSTFVNQQTGQGWQSQQGTMGGLEQLPTVPVFPRPGQPQ